MTRVWRIAWVVMFAAGFGALFLGRAIGLSSQTTTLIVIGIGAVIVLVATDLDFRERDRQHARR